MSAVAAIALLRRFGPIALIVGAIAAALLFRAQRDDARQTLVDERITSAVEAASARAEQEHRLAAATSTYADRLAAREPIIVHSTNTVREYAQTDAGRALCLGADRVRGLDAIHAALGRPDPATAGGRDEALRADTDPAGIGR